MDRLHGHEEGDVRDCEGLHLHPLLSCVGGRVGGRVHGESPHLEELGQEAARQQDVRPGLRRHQQGRTAGGHQVLRHRPRSLQETVSELTSRN